jgi:hypothetical protein
MAQWDVLAQVQKSNFFLRKTVYPETFYLENTIPYINALAFTIKMNICTCVSK